MTTSFIKRGDELGITSLKRYHNSEAKKNVTKAKAVNVKISEPKAKPKAKTRTKTKKVKEVKQNA